MPDQTKYTTKLANARILIIGGSSGIGYGLAEASIEHNALVTIASSSPSRVAAAVSKLRAAYPSKASNIHGLTADLSNPQTLESALDTLFADTAAHYPGAQIDHVVFTAGDALRTMPLAGMSMANVLAAGQLRFFAPLLAAKCVARYLPASPRSSYTITTGGISERPVREWSVVAAYAGGLHSMVRNLALDLAPVRVNGVSPGAVDTELWRLGESEKREFFEEVGAKMTTGCVGRVEDVVETFLGVLRDGNMSGSVVRTDGGRFLM
ncbi:short chain dehydrogenase [Trematosphaeria pertusa]|uniref:Short chain dehydrogenase n=1 Tax=Trematosphaeria pertusa TaxID=390896 RepID=A0A6A6INS0_9PLEO|nr:short chain dehydrogenase [Trematosphaeria pertusa]KAF2252036.1 short chain dehydrogenase [Trematosphaeria pertusa]